MLIFSLSGTYIVDLKDDESHEARLSTRLLPDYLADFLSTMVKLTQRKKVGKPEDHKETITIQTEDDPIVNMETKGFVAKTSF